MSTSAQRDPPPCEFTVTVLPPEEITRLRRWSNDLTNFYVAPSQNEIDAYLAAGMTPPTG